MSLIELLGKKLKDDYSYFSRKYPSCSFEDKLITFPP